MWKCLGCDVIFPLPKEKYKFCPCCHSRLDNTNTEGISKPFDWLDNLENVVLGLQDIIMDLYLDYDEEQSVSDDTSIDLKRAREMCLNALELIKGGKR